MDSDGFLLVTKKKACRKLNKKNEDQISTSCAMDVSASKIQRNINIAIKQLKEERYINNVLQQLSTILDGKKIVKIKCFGIGHFGELDGNGTHQLALLLLLLKHYKIEATIKEPILRQAEIDFINNNFGCKYVAGSVLTDVEISESQKDYVLFFVPHGEDLMYNEILKTHSSENQRKHLILLGNILDDLSVSYKDFSQFTTWKKYYDTSKKIFLPNYNGCFGAFNNTCIMYN
uniref:SRR1 domain-containing protein n=1 Tax=Parastrongyloides trichosuri TaxID=131310 RepID=A0A0N4Z9P3_PARTI